MSDVRLQLRGWTYSEPARKGRSLVLAARGWTCGEPLSRGMVGERCGAGRTHGMLRSTSALLRPGTQSRPQVIQLVPFSSSPHTSVRRNLHTAYRDVSWRSTYTYTTHTLIEEKLSRASTCTSVFSTHLLRHSVSWRNAGLYWRLWKGPLSGLCLQGWNKPWPHYGQLVLCLCIASHSKNWVLHVSFSSKKSRFKTVIIICLP